MTAILVSLLLQAATTQQVATPPTTPAEAPAPEQAESAGPEQPERKRVCRKQIDSRTGHIAKQRKICRFVDAADERVR